MAGRAGNLCDLICPADDPVAVVETAQVVRVKTISEICAELDGPWRRRMADALDNRAQAVGEFPRGFDSRFSSSMLIFAGLKTTCWPS